MKARKPIVIAAAVLLVALIAVASVQQWEKDAQRKAQLRAAQSAYDAIKRLSESSDRFEYALRKRDADAALDAAHDVIPENHLEALTAFEWMTDRKIKGDNPGREVSKLYLECLGESVYITGGSGGPYAGRCLQAKKRWNTGVCETDNVFRAEPRKCD